jgi:Domain of unknown function (DUF4149)
MSRTRLEMRRESRLGTRRVLPYFGAVSFFLRLTGILNGAVWFGTAVFFMVAVWPGFSSAEMLRILPRSHSGAAAQVILSRYCVLQYCCGIIALGHLVLEWLYAGIPLRRWIVYWVGGLLGLALFSGMVVQPRLARRHLDFYGVRSTPQQRQEASRYLPIWHGLVQVNNGIMVLGLGVYMWQIASAGAGAGARSLRRAQTEGLTNRVW